MTLQATLDAIKEASATKLPAETREVMHRETQALVDANLADRAPQLGAPSLQIELDGPDDTFNLGIERADSTVVITWFRGNW